MSRSVGASPRSDVVGSGPYSSLLLKCLVSPWHVCLSSESLACGVKHTGLLYLLVKEPRSVDIVRTGDCGRSFSGP